MKRLSLSAILFLASLPAFAADEVTLTINGVRVYTTGTAPTPGPAPGPAPVPTPQPVPAPNDCGSDSADADWNPLTNTKMFPSRPIEASGDRGTAIRFVANKNLYPNGVVMEVFDQSGSTLLKDAVISVCPHSFNPVGGNSYCAKSGIANQGDFGLRFGPVVNYYDCALTPGNTYYLNFRAYDVPRGTVTSQFVNFVR